MILLNSPRISCQWKIGGTESFRLASSKMLKGQGRNLQNLSENESVIVIPDDGYKFINADQSGAEALIVAYLAKDGPFRQLFKLGIKPHTYLGFKLFTTDWNKEILDSILLNKCKGPALAVHSLWPEVSKKVAKHKYRYFIGKKVIHAKNYNMYAQTFRTSVLIESEGEISLSTSEAETFLTTHETEFPEIGEWQRNTLAYGQKTRILHNLFGHPRYFGRHWDNGLEREMLAFVPQSTVGSITNRAFVAMQSLIDEKYPQWHLLNNKHDSILMEVPENESVEASEILRKSLCCNLKSPGGEEFQMKSEVSTGYNWGSYDPNDNPAGMKEV